MRTAVKAPFLSFVHTNAEQSLLVAEGDGYIYSQTPNTLSVANPSRDSVLLRYQNFIDDALHNKQTIYRYYLVKGGEASFFHRCWTPLLTEAAEEAGKLVNEFSGTVQDKQKLLQELKRISEGCLLVLDKALI